MTMDANRRAFVDTNVWLNTIITTAPEHESARRWLARLKAEEVVFCVSPQVLREYLVAVTRGTIFESTLTPEEAVQDVESILDNIQLLEESATVSYILRDLVRRYQVRGKQVHDANIVATMLAHGVSHLLTYNPDDFCRFEEITLEPGPPERVGQVPGASQTPGT
ncbi:MAG: type II toxin-antitoxin system VapC family toxin [Anaerolineae bacterium]